MALTELADTLEQIEAEFVEYASTKSAGRRQLEGLGASS